MMANFLASTILMWRGETPEIISRCLTSGIGAPESFLLPGFKINAWHWNPMAIANPNISSIEILTRGFVGWIADTKPLKLDPAALCRRVLKLLICWLCLWSAVNGALRAGPKGISCGDEQSTSIFLKILGLALFNAIIRLRKLLQGQPVRLLIMVDLPEFFSPITPTKTGNNGCFWKE